MSTPVPSISIVIPATNDPPTLRPCLDAIAAGTEVPADVVVVREPRGAGPAVARNEGVRRSTGDIILFIDADVAVHGDAVARVRRTLTTRTEVDAVFGSYDDRPADPSVVSRFRNLLHHWVHHEGAGAADTFWAALGAVRRQPFVDIGGFDEAFANPSIEDVELGMRLSSAGHAILLDPSIQGTHLKRWTLGDMIRTDFWNRGVPWVELLVRSRAVPSSLNLAWRHRISAAVSISLAGAAVFRRGRLVAASVLTLVSLNCSFYRLLFRVGGPRQLLAALPLHVIHHLVATASVPVALVRLLINRGGRWSRAQR